MSLCLLELFFHALCFCLERDHPLLLLIKLFGLCRLIIKVTILLVVKLLFETVAFLQKFDHFHLQVLSHFSQR